MSDRFEYGIESDYAMEDGSGSSLRGVREKWKMIWGVFFSAVQRLARMTRRLVARSFLKKRCKGSEWLSMAPIKARLCAGTNLEDSGVQLLSLSLLASA